MREGGAQAYALLFEMSYYYVVSLALNPAVSNTRKCGGKNERTRTLLAGCPAPGPRSASSSAIEYVLEEPG